MSGTDFVTLSCGHLKPIVGNPLNLVCDVVMKHRRTKCGCEQTIRCCDKEKIESAFCCLSKQIRRPRCGHILKTSCHIVTPLGPQWKAKNPRGAIIWNQNVDQHLTVPYSNMYGEAESEVNILVPECKAIVDYFAYCGHTFRNILCCEAFKAARNNEIVLKCNEITLRKCILCRAPYVAVPCRLAAECDSLDEVLKIHPMNAHTLLQSELIRAAQNVTFSASMVELWTGRCESNVHISRECGHTIDMVCFELFAHMNQGIVEFPPCVEIIERKLSCGHVIKIQCCDQHDAEPTCNLLSSQRFFYSCGKHFTDTHSCAELQALQAQCDADGGFCPIAEVKTIVSPVCGHDIEVPCWVATVLLDNSQPLETIRLEPPVLPKGITANMLYCSVPVKYVRENCGHSETMCCFDIHFGKVKPCTQTSTVVCPRVNCRQSRVVCCGGNGVADLCAPCENQDYRLCGLCGVNMTFVKCSTDDVCCGESVTAHLACGHLASWQCGKQPDPRGLGAKAAESCATCVVAAWEVYLENLLPNSAPGGFRDPWQPLRSLIGSEVGECVKIVEQIPLMTDTRLHTEARCRIYRAVQSTLTLTAGGTITRAEHPPCVDFLAPDELWGGAYTWVVCVVNGTDGDIAAQYNSPQRTSFGSGVRLEVLTDAALQRLCPADSKAEVHLCVGVVYARRVMRSSAVLQASGNGEKEQTSPIPTHSEFGGFDAVIYTQLGGDAQPTKKDKPDKRRYHLSWESGAAVPLAVVTVRPLDRCLVCFESFNNGGGLTCRQRCGTFTCWECLQQTYGAASQAGAIQGGFDQDGNLLCSNLKCRCPITVNDLAKVDASNDILQACEQLKLQTVVATELAQALNTQKLQLEAEYARIEAIKDADERVAAKLRLRIVNEILTLRCPRCQMAFAEFDGCFALTCGNRSCRCGICAWCLADCGSDAHQHVPSCAENKTGGVHGTFQAFEKHHRRRRATATAKLIAQQKLSKSVVLKLKLMISTDLSGLKITEKEVFGV